MKTPPNANNKSMSGSAKQQLPMKLSSLSQSKGERASIGSIVSPVSSSSGVTQLLPLKLADKKVSGNQNNSITLINNLYFTLESESRGWSSSFTNRE